MTSKKMSGDENTIIGGEIPASPNSMMEKDCTDDATWNRPKCQIDCSGDSGGLWEDDTSSQYLSSCSTTKNTYSRCRKRAVISCPWEGFDSPVGEWVTNPSTIGKSCTPYGKGAIFGNSSGGTIKCTGKAGGWLKPQTGGAPLTDEAILRSINSHKTHYPNDVDGQNLLMKLFCTGGADTSVNKCADKTDPTYGTAIPQTACSRYSVEGKVGDACRYWINSLSRDDATRLYQAVTQEHCGKPENLQAPECACLNAAAQDPNGYGQVKKNIDSPDRCWYIPCSGSMNSFVKPDDYTSDCPNSCVQVIDAEGKAKITASAFIQTQNCSGSGGGGDGGKALLFAIAAGVAALLIGLLIVRLISKRS